MNIEKLVKLLEEVLETGSIKIDEPLKNHTSFKLGGPADIFVSPGSEKELSDTIKLCTAEFVPYLILGNGTNLIVRDKGIRGVVINVKEAFRDYSIDKNRITAGAGLLLSEVSNIACENELGGLEFASGIPGTLGGAVAMNAGAYGGEMKDVVTKTWYVDKFGTEQVVEGEEHKFGYRKSIIQENGGIVVKAEMRLRPGAKCDIKALVDDFGERRKQKQPLELPSAGSVFKRPEGYFAGKLIEDCGLRGFSIGGAEVSAKHCGFIVNRSNASTDDVLNLISHVQKVVKEKTGVFLETEVKIVGEE